MTLSHKHRTTIYAKLSPIVGEEEADALLSQFPSRDTDEPATRADFQLLAADVQVTAAELRVEMQDLRVEVQALLVDMQGEVQGLRVEMHSLFRRQTVWMVSALFGGLSVGMGLAAGVASVIAA
ncbi:hypothetical protein [Iamia sp.]|uniref:hypothetical protein n=1 Tax=Iamia sp. TaxID=2722710 RepID=UPI002B910B0C|nr:hypothetical protein [Iamia sp.]HXH58660.1 hypothetical protein [Iamia sp.]